MFWWTLAAIVYLWLMVDLTICGQTKISSCWAADNWSCADPEPYLLVGLGNAILQMNLDGSGQEQVVSGVGKAILLDIDFRAGRVYWINTHTGVLSRAGLDGKHRKKLLTLGKGISGMAVDWIEKSIFWSSRKRGMIQRVDSDGKNKKTILRDLSQPSSLVIDPNERFLFWVSAGVTPSIQRSDTKGGVRTTVLKVPSKLLALAVDPVDRRLFWVQQGSGKPGVLGSCDYNGNIISVVSQPLRLKSLKMSVFLEYMYITNSTSNSITRINKYTGVPPEKISSIQLQHPPTDVKVIHPFNQPTAEVISPHTSGGCDPQMDDCVSVCSMPGSNKCKCRTGFTLSKQGDYCEDINECALWNHGCSLGCENVPGSYFCTCPKGYLLLSDAKTCREIEPCVENGTRCDYACTHTQDGDVCVCPVGSILQPDGWSCTGPPAFLLFANGVDIKRDNLDGSGSRTLLEDPGGSLRAVDYDPLENMVYFASTEQQHIGRISMDGGSREQLLSTGPPSSPEALALDWVNRKLYWTDAGSSSVSRSELDGQDRKVLIFEKLLKPRGIAVHPQAQKLFWTDVGSRPAVEWSNLEGLDREVLVSAGLIFPSGLALDFSSQRLYWSDLTTGLIETVRLDGSDRLTLTQNQVGNPFALAVFEDTLWVSDWVDKQLYRLNKKTGSGLERLRVETVQPAAIIIIHPLSKPGADLCLHGNGGCSHICESRLGLVRCSCYSQHVLSADGKTCLPSGTPSTGPGDGEWSGQLKNKSLNDESLPSDSREPTFTEKMVSDQDECFSLSCDVNAQCVLVDGGAVCRCVSGYTGDGKICVDIDECSADLAECVSVLSECVNTAGGYFCQCRAGFSGDGHHCIDIDECRLELHSCDVNAECLNTLGQYECRCKEGFIGSGFSCHEDSKDVSSRPTMSSPLEITYPWRRRDVESCPSSHESYCLYNGVCFYFPDMESYGCNCVPGFIGERCQFSDLEWWELQQAKEEKRKNTAIAVCVMLLVLLLSFTASITYCYRCRRCVEEQPTVDSMSETNMSEESITETLSGAPQLYLVLESGTCIDGKMLHSVSCQRKTACPSSSSDTGDHFVSEEAGTLKPLDLPKPSSSCNSFISNPGTPLKPLDNLISLEDPNPKTPQVL
ncbi:pro-epidermal growth factor isoform X1 [Hoplias malabaricus]|uniref:pro-epidermal growth factor isoform X1 n=1 Tax=Hoplias malabaricus TaxID=27720 RepID=UPI003461A074